MKKILSAVIVIALGLMVSGKAHAGQLSNAILTLGDATPVVASSMTFTFIHPSASTLKSIVAEVCQLPSGSCVKPPSMTIPTPVNNVAGWVGLTSASWGATGANGTGKIVWRAVDQTNGQYVNTNANITMGSASDGFVNPTVADCNNSVDASAGTCYVRLTTYSDDQTTAVDSTIVSYTIIKSVQVTARVDPTFTFVVSGVAANLVVNNALTTTVATDYWRLPFGNLTAGTPKYATHKLNVTTNTKNGYTVTSFMKSQMTGVYNTNNVDPFVAPWSAATSWTEPSGSTPNDNTAWFGANTTDTDVTNWTGGGFEQKFGGVGSTTAVTVMQDADSDNGATPVYVTYALEANVYQPADTYTGTMVYNALPTY